MAEVAEPGSARAMESWLLPFTAMFTQPSWLNAVALATGALLCLNRRTVCAALRAVDGAADKGFGPDGEPIVAIVDDTIERRRGAKIRDKGIYRDAVRSSRSFFVKVEGLRWLSFQLAVRPGFTGRTWGLPFRTVLCRPERADAGRKRRHQAVPEKAA